VCKADEGEISIDANPTGGGIFNEEGHDIQFLMESSTYIDETTGVPTVKTKSHTCYEVPADANGQPTITFEDCESGNYSDSDCKVGEFTLDQKVEDLDGGDGVLSNCLQFNQSGGLETYRCQVSNGAPKEYWVWHLKPVDADRDKFCDPTACAGDCGVAMGTTDGAKPGEYPPYGIVWQYNQYKDPDSGEILLADFSGNWCHTGSFCLDDDIVCEVKSAKLDLRTDSTANYTIVEVDTVQTFNGNSTSGNVPTDFLSTAEAGELLVDPTEIDFINSGITVNGAPVSLIVSNTETDRDGDTFPDVRTHIDQADFQKALYPLNDCTPEDAKEVLFKGTLDGKVWIGPTTVNVVCN
jgi:hypothetical protein